MTTKTNHKWRFFRAGGFENFLHVLCIRFCDAFFNGLRSAFNKVFGFFKA